jgi:hypothetical protein
MPRKSALILPHHEVADQSAMVVELLPGQLSPLEYLLKRINDPTTPLPIRDQLAIAAAPYCHPKLVERQRGTKKERAAKAAASAGIGTGWGKDLEFEDRAQ